MDRWIYKFLVSERFKTGVWYAVEEDDKKIDPKHMHNYLNELGQSGWELITVVPVGQTVLMHDQILKHILKKQS
jgi:uncharacterized protein DUF4177